MLVQVQEKSYVSAAISGGFLFSSIYFVELMTESSASSVETGVGFGCYAERHPNLSSAELTRQREWKTGCAATRRWEGKWLGGGGQGGQQPRGPLVHCVSSTLRLPGGNTRGP